MVLYIVHQTAYNGESSIEGSPLRGEERNSYPVPLRNNLRITTQVSNQEPTSPDGDRFCGCCPSRRRGIRTIELTEQHFLVNHSWDLYAVSETTHKVFYAARTDNDNRGTATAAITKPTITIVRFALVPQSVYHNSLRTWPNWQYLGECTACMLRLVVEENMRPVLPTPTTRSSPTLHFHMDIFADAIAVDMPCRLVLLRAAGRHRRPQPTVVFAAGENKQTNASATNETKKSVKNKKAQSTRALSVISNQQGN